MSQDVYVEVVRRSSSLQEACDGFLATLRDWAYACIDEFELQPALDGHDQLTYTTGWEPYVLASRDPRVIRFLKEARQKVADHLTRSGAWRHGYWRMQEAHHGTEHFELFLGFLMRVSPESTATRDQLVDAAEHIGNWSDAIPDWFDYETGLFHSLHFGADGVRPDEGQLNMPDHLRCANMLMLAYAATGDKKYLDLAATYSERWASAICEVGQPVPVGIAREGVVRTLSDSSEQRYRAFAGMAGALDCDLERAENILASGGIQLFLSLWRETGQDVFLYAVIRLLSVLVGALPDVDAGVVADAVRRYRHATGRHDFDGRLSDALQSLSPTKVCSIGLTLPPPLRGRPSGVGKRGDMPVWTEDGQPRRHNPILLSVAAEIQDDPALATCSVDLAQTYLSLAIRALPAGRHHGCAARTVSAVARGHGRENHAGMATAVVWPVMQQFGLLA